LVVEFFGNGSHRTTFLVELHHFSDNQMLFWINHQLAVEVDKTIRWLPCVPVRMAITRQSFVIEYTSSCEFVLLEAFQDGCFRNACTL
jgi:hypothetical protein